MSSQQLKTIPHRITKQIRLDPDRWAIFREYIRRYMGWDLVDWQQEEFQKMLTTPMYLLNWGRGMSKTMLLTLVSVYAAIFDLKVCYAVPREDQLVQPQEYFNKNPFVDCNPYKKGYDKSIFIQKSKWYSVLGKPSIKLTNIDDKGNNLSSGRFDYLILDECALLMYMAMEEQLFNKGNGMLRASDYPHIIYASTPLIGSFFFTLYETYPAAWKSWRNFENTPNNFISNTPQKRAQIEQERAMAERTGILFAWETENLAIPHGALGAAYKNYVIIPRTDLEQLQPTHIGFDFHGYITGHIWVAMHYNPHRDPNALYILREGAEVYEETATADESMAFLEHDPYFHGPLLKGESGGMINDPYVKKGAEYGMEPVSIQGDEKKHLAMNMLRFLIYVNPELTPNFYSDMKDAEWKDPNKFELHKEASGNKFRNHYLDAGQNGMPTSQLTEGFYIPNKMLNSTPSILEAEARRAAERSRARMF